MIITIGFVSFHAVAKFLEDNQSGALAEHFKPIQDVVKRFEGYEEFELKTDIEREAFITGLGMLHYINIS